MNQDDLYPYGDKTFSLTQTYNGYDFYIHSNGIGNPCAYIVLHKDDPWVGLGFDDIAVEDIDKVHGGFTYAADHLPWDVTKKFAWVIGWDYCHTSDAVIFIKADYMLPGTQWTLGDIIKHAKAEIDVIIKAKGETND